MADSGNFSAYRQLTPLKGSVVDDIQNQEELGFKRRAEQRELDKVNQAKKDAADKKKAEIYNGIVAQNPYDTGSKTKNEAIIKGISKAKDEWEKIIPILENESGYSVKEVVSAKMKAQNLNKFSENLAAFDKTVTKRDLDYRTAKEANSIFENPEYEKNYQAGYANKSIGIDEQGMPVLYFIDNNNDGLDDNTGKAGKIGDYESYAEMETGTGIKYDFQKRFDKENLVKEAVTKIQPEVNQQVRGGLIVKTTGLNKEAVTQHVQDMFYDAKGNPSEVLKSLAKENNVAITDIKGLNAIKDDFINSINLYAKKGVEENPNTQALEREKFNYQKSRDAKKDKEDENTPIGINVKDAALRSDSIKSGIDKTKILPEGEYFSKGVFFNNIGGKTTGLDNVNVKAVFLTKNNKIVFTSEVLDSKASGEAIEGEDGTITYKNGSKYRQETRTATAGTETQIAQARGFDNAEAYKKHLKGLNPVSEKGTSTKQRTYKGVDDNGNPIWE